MNETKVLSDTDPTPDHSESRENHHEARKYRKRAQAAEQTAAELQQELDATSSRVRELEETITALERRSRIDELLLDSDAMDLESARLLTEMAVAEMEQPDVDAAVAELKRRKPYLFRTGARNGASALAPKHEERATAHSEAASAAEAATASGSRTDLLRYLRLRRKK